MSDLRIKDGAGTGSVAIVKEGRLYANSVCTNTLTYQSDSTGYSFIYGIYNKTLPGTDEYTILRIKNVDNSRHFHIHRFILSWNGGSTNHNRTIAGSMYVGTYAPSANYTSTAPSSSNFGVNLTAPSESQIWDGVGNGMTVATNGVLAFSHYFAIGTTDVITDGSIIVPYGLSIGFTVKGEEVGLFSFLVSGWYEAI